MGEGKRSVYAEEAELTTYSFNPCPGASDATGAYHACPCTDATFDRAVRIRTRRTQRKPSKAVARDLIPERHIVIGVYRLGRIIQ